MTTCPLCQKCILPYALLEEDESTEEFCVCSEELDMFVFHIIQDIFTGGSNGAESIF